MIEVDVSQESNRTRRTRSHSTESTGSSRHRQHTILAEINERITRLGDRPTPRRLRVIQHDLAQHTRFAAGRNDVVGTYAHVALLQRDVIDGQNARHLLANQYQLHLRTQLAAKSRPKAPGGVLKSGFGALDEEALCALEAERDAKVAAEAAKVAEREIRETERAAAKILKASELAARAEARLEAAALKETEKEATRVAKAAEKILRDAEKEARRIAKAAEKVLKIAEKKTVEVAKAAEKAEKAAQIIATRAAAAATRGHKTAHAQGGGWRGRGKRAQGARSLPMPVVVSSEPFDTSGDLTNSSNDPSSGSSGSANEASNHSNMESSAAPSSDSVVTSVTPVILRRVAAAANIQSTCLIPPGNFSGRTRAGRKVQLTRRALGVEL